MNKQDIDEEIVIAYRAISETKIANEKREVSKTFRGYIVSFGASIMMGSLLSAIAFFSENDKAEDSQEKETESISDNEKAKIGRAKLFKAIYYILQERKKTGPDDHDLFEYAKNHKEESKEEILNAAIALKLAINMYDLV